MSQVSIELLGGLTVSRDGQQVDLGSRRTAALFAYLVRGREVHQRDDLATLLWDENHASTAPGNLRVLLTNLRRTVGDLVQITRTTVGFRPRDCLEVNLDVETFLAHVPPEANGTSGRAPDPGEIAGLEAALAAYRGEFLDGFELPDSVRFEHWQRRERDQLHAQRASVQRRLVDAHLAAGSPQAAVGHARALVELDPLDELAHRSLIQAHAVAGDAEAAVRQYRALSVIQRDELGTTPSPATRALVADLPGFDPRPVNGRVAGARRVVPPRPRPSEGERRPQAPWSRFVGRKAQLATMLSGYAEVVQGRGSVLLVEGEPGCGKTALVRQFVRLLLDRDPDVVALAGSCATPESLSDPPALVSHLLDQLDGGAGGPWLDGPVPRRVAARLRAAATPTDADGQAPPGRLAARIREELRHRPVVLVVDDLQWASPGVVELVAGLANDVRRHRLLLIGTVRPHLPRAVSARQSDAAVLLPRLRRLASATVLGLDHDSPEAAAEFVDALLDDRHGSLPVTFRQELLRRSEGHPLIAVELLRDLSRVGLLEGDRGSDLRLTGEVTWDWVPERVGSLLDETLLLVPEEAWLPLEVAAAHGHAFDAHVVAEVSGRPAGEVLHAFSRTLGSNLGLVQPAGQRHTSVTHRFRHRLMREHVLAQVDPALRAHLGRRVQEATSEVRSAPGPRQPVRSQRPSGVRRPR